MSKIRFVIRGSFAVNGHFEEANKKLCNREMSTEERQKVIAFTTVKITVTAFHGAGLYRLSQNEVR